ncbi:NADH dehydrogenase [Prunus yedoensis var. nudiflora]|uniref:NADH dehydrogenase n=1 Tax=Prunus yedoensis var. nudiflora TaxID=2094558 RepID=A0A314Z0C0_PRUYE|nr:NADH dehydrogenase [Prunus yedoensis var. nudiflora]
MSFIQRAVKVPPNSVSLEEARHRVFDFFRAACRSIPTIMEIYNLDDVVAPSHLRSVVASEIRKHSSVTNPKVIDMLLFKAMEELNNITEHAKQRHHIIGQYVLVQAAAQVSLAFRLAQAGGAQRLPRQALAVVNGIGGLESLLPGVAPPAGNALEFLNPLIHSFLGSENENGPLKMPPKRPPSGKEESQREWEWLVETRCRGF